MIAACRIYEAEQERRALSADLRQGDAIPGHGDARRRSSSGIEIKLGHEATVRARANGQVVAGDGAGDGPLTAAVAFASSVTWAQAKPDQRRTSDRTMARSIRGLTVGRALDECQRDVELCGRSSFVGVVL